MKWKVEFLHKSIVKLGESLDLGPIIEFHPNGDLVELEKQLVARAGNFHVHIYSNEHPPPHFHVKYGALENSYSITDCKPLHTDGNLKRYYKNIQQWHNENRSVLIEYWNDSRPSDCPVGKIKH